MSEKYTTLEKEGYGEYTEKKSVFIAHALPVKTEEDAVGYIKKIRKDYSDASHNVYAYLLSEKNITRYSDDKEPSQTAGMPVLDVIRKGGFCDAAIVVTRYFGGTLLGTGGLVRSYTAAAAAAVADAHIVTYELFITAELCCGYSDYQKLIPLIASFEIKTDSSDFSSEVILSLAVYEPLAEAFFEKAAEISGGRIRVRKTGERFDVKYI